MPPPSPALGRGRTLAVITGGTGVVAAAAGVFFGLRAKSIYDDAGCLGTVCDENGLARTSHAHDAASASTVAFVGAGVLLSAAAILWFVTPDKHVVLKPGRFW
jgi:hypothetical protein